MGFNLGMIVSYNNQNYLILEIIEKDLVGGNIVFLKLKNLINQEIITVDSRKVNNIELKSKNETNLNSTDTNYIESLFSSALNNKKNSQDSLNLFDISGDETFTLDEIVFDNLQNKSNNNIQQTNFNKEETKNNDTQLVENFQVPNSNTYLTPRRQSMIDNLTPISETFSDLKLVGEIPTQTSEFIPTRRLNEEKQKVLENNNIDKTKILEEIDDNNFVPFNESNKSSLNVQHEEVSSLLNQINNDTKIIEKRMKEENNIYSDQSVDEDFSESLDSEVVEKEITARQSGKNISQIVNEKHFDSLETGPLNTKKLFDNFNKQQKIQENLNQAYKNNCDSTNTIFGVSEGFSSDKLTKSRIYKKFKIMSGILITLTVFLFLIPILAIFVKAAIIWLDTKIIDIKKIFEISFTNKVDVIFLSLSIFIISIFLIYLISYLVIINDKQYKKIAYYNFQLENKVEVIDSIQEYNNESSIYLIKVHNEIKQMKKDIKYLKDEKNKTNMSERKKDNLQRYPH